MNDPLSMPVVAKPPRYRCPGCHSAEHLFEGVEVTGSSWRSVDAHLEATERATQVDIDWIDEWPDGTLGCSNCDWRGEKRDLEPLGIDDEPLPAIHPNQLQIEEAA